MNKAELVQQLEGQLGSKKAAADALNAVIDTITRAVVKGEKVSITGFGTFEKVTRAARKGRNPRTGESVRIKRTNVPKFRPGATLKGYVADPKTLPKPEKPAKKTTTTAAKPAAKKTTAKAATKTTAKKTTAKAAPKKATATKTAAKKTTAKAAPKKAVTKKTTATKAKTTAKKATTKKAAAKKR